MKPFLRQEIDHSLAHYSTVGFPPIILPLSFTTLNEKTDCFLKNIRPMRGGSVELLNLLLKGRT